MDMEQEQKTLKVKTADEFRKRMKSSFGSQFVEEAQEGGTGCCLICTNELELGYGRIVRKCLVSEYPCSSSVCQCAPLVCYK